MSDRPAEKLSLADVNVPDVEDFFNKNSLNANLDRDFGASPRVPASWPEDGMWLQLVRLTDKALREYDAGPTELLLYLDNPENVPRVSPYIRAIDHLENALDAAARAVRLALRLRQRGYGRGARPVTPLREKRLRDLRNSIVHTDERLDDGHERTLKRFSADQPFALRLSNSGITLGRNYLSFRDLRRVLIKLYLIIEAIRGPSVRPGDAWSNARIRTESGQPNSSDWHQSEYSRERSRSAVHDHHTPRAPK